jgi:hypothetical protein
LSLELSHLRNEISIKIQGTKGLLRSFEIYLRYLEISEILQTWTKGISLHLVPFKINYHVYYYCDFQVSLEAFI